MFYCVTPFILLRLCWRSIREPAYRATPLQRFGLVAKNNAVVSETVSVEKAPIWVHAVSAGESIAAVPLIKRFINAGHRVIVTSMTPTGRERINSLLGDQVEHYYAPYDLPGAVNRFLVRARPLALVIIDTELWPNTIHYTALMNVPIYLVNGRLSEKSARGYQRISFLSKPMVEKLTRVFAQTQKQGQRFRDIGVSENQLSVSGSIKFDITLPDDMAARLAELQHKFVGRRVFLAASTHEGEESEVLHAYKIIQADSSNLLIIAPRHPHRADRVHEVCQSMGFNVIRHSQNLPCTIETSVYLLDTMGELTYFYGVAEIAFVGGSLVDVGGHNPMEPANLGTPILMGEYRRNIDDIADQFVSAGAMQIVSNAGQMADLWQTLLADDLLRQKMSTAAKQVMTENKGSLDRIEKEILQELE